MNPFITSVLSEIQHCLWITASNPIHFQVFIEFIIESYLTVYCGKIGSRPNEWNGERGERAESL